MLEEVILSSEGYELLDSGDGRRLERFGNYTVVRPDPSVLWSVSQKDLLGWQRPDAFFVGKAEPSGWQADPKLLEGWPVKFGPATFLIKPTAFRHMGLFPEQAGQWEWLQGIITGAGDKKVSVLNLFSYTGVASVLASMAGAEVTHVEASKGNVYWAKDNAQLSGCPDDAIRWIVDDALKFVKREVRRGKKYDVIIMDPPVFGRGPKGEIWRLEEKAGELFEQTAALLSAKPLALLVNFYATALYPHALHRLAQEKYAGYFPSLQLGSLFLKETSSGNLLPTGFFLRS